MLTRFMVHNDYVPQKKAENEGCFITVAGNVGAGKSTLTKILGHALGFNTSFEKVIGNPYLEDFYQDQKRWSFHLQLYFLSQRFQDQKRIGQQKSHHIQDRSIYEDVEIFARSLYENDKMSQRDFDTYSELFHCMMTPYLIKPDLMIFLSGSIETVLNRISMRGRDMEKRVPQSYWMDLHRRYEQWISEYKESPVLVVNIDEVDLLSRPEQVDLIKNEIEEILSIKNECVSGY